MTEEIVTTSETLASKALIELEQKITRDMVIETLFGTLGTISSTTLDFVEPLNVEITSINMKW